MSPPVSPPRPGPAHLCPSCPEHSPPAWLLTRPGLCSLSPAGLSLYPAPVSVPFSPAVTLPWFPYLSPGPPVRTGVRGPRQRTAGAQAGPPGAGGRRGWPESKEPTGTAGSHRGSPGLRVLGACSPACCCRVLASGVWRSPHLDPPLPVCTTEDEGTLCPAGIAEGSRSAYREGTPRPELPTARGTGVRVRPGRAASSGLCFISTTGTDTSRTRGHSPENKPCTGGPRQAGLTKPHVRGTAQTRRHQGSGRGSPTSSAGRPSVSAPPSPSGPLSREPWAQLYRHRSLLQDTGLGDLRPLSVFVVHAGKLQPQSSAGLRVWCRVSAQGRVGLWTKCPSWGEAKSPVQPQVRVGTTTQQPGCLRRGSGRKLWTRRGAGQEAPTSKGGGVVSRLSLD